MTGNSHRRSWGSFSLFASLKAAASVKSEHNRGSAESPTSELPEPHDESCDPEVKTSQERSNHIYQKPGYEIRVPKSYFRRLTSRPVSADKLASNSKSKPISKVRHKRNSENSRRPSWRSIRRFSPTTSSDCGSGTEDYGDRSQNSIKKSSISAPVLTSTTNIKIAAAEGVNATPLRLGELSGSSASKKGKVSNSLQLESEDQIPPGRHTLAKFRKTFSSSFFPGNPLYGQNKHRASEGFVELSASRAGTPTFEKRNKRHSSYLMNIGKEKINNFADSCGVKHASTSLRRNSVNHQKQKSWSSAVKTSNSTPFSDSMRELLSQSLPRRRSLLQSSLDDLSLEKSFADAVDKLDFLDSREDLKAAPADGSITSNGVPPIP